MGKEGNVVDVVCNLENGWYVLRCKCCHVILQDKIPDLHVMHYRLSSCIDHSCKED